MNRADKIIRALPKLLVIQGLTLEEIAKKFNVSRQYIGQLIKQNCMFSLSECPANRKTDIRYKEILEYELNECEYLEEIVKKHNISAHSIKRWAKHHGLTVPTTTELRLRRFYNKIRIDEGHWIWIGCLHGQNQSPRFGAARSGSARNYSYITHNKGTIPEKHSAYPICGEKFCVNPEHLELFTRYPWPKRKRI